MPWSRLLTKPMQYNWIKKDNFFSRIKCIEITTKSVPILLQKFYLQRLSEEVRPRLCTHQLIAWIIMGYLEKSMESLIILRRCPKLFSPAHSFSVHSFAYWYNDIILRCLNNISICAIRKLNASISFHVCCLHTSEKMHFQNLENFLDRVIIIIIMSVISIARVENRRKWQVRII